MPGNPTAKPLEVNPSLLAFRPRQVALLSKPQIMKPDNNTRTLALKPEQKALLYVSVAQFLQRSGFSKTVKKFLSEASIEKDDLGNSSYDLEEMFCKFLAMCNDVSKNSESRKVKDGEVDDTSDVDGKKSSGKASKSENVGDVIDNAVPIDKKSKEKKRSKKDKDTIGVERTGTEVLEETDSGANDESKEEKKKKKKNKKSSDPVIAEEKGNKNDSKKEEIESPGETEKENKSSKKRKREAAGDSVQPASVNAVEEPKKKKEQSKRQKTEVSEELKVEGAPTELKSATKSEDGNNQESQKTSTEPVNGLSNGSFEKSESSIKKGAKEQNGSAEPKVVKHFQRVKVEEVVFSDERLKDNSYWAKDGADIGYGAKAQEILEQVRGRDFRHEKTKKKRGSYRGGQIDLQSHSVKFNYSDDE